VLIDVANVVGRREHPGCEVLGFGVRVHGSGLSEGYRVVRFKGSGLGSGVLSSGFESREQGCEVEGIGVRA